MDQYTPPPPMAATTPLTATLTAEEWNIVQAGLHELPMKLARGVSEKLAQQLFVQASRRMSQGQQVPQLAPEDYGAIQRQLPSNQED